MIESSGFGADKFTMVRNNDGTGSLKVVQPLDFEDNLQSQGFRFRIQVRKYLICWSLCTFRMLWAGQFVKIKLENSDMLPFRSTTKARITITTSTMSLTRGSWSS